jgi:hypothetical protein
MAPPSIQQANSAASSTTTAPAQKIRAAADLDDVEFIQSSGYSSGLFAARHRAFNIKIIWKPLTALRCAFRLSPRPP